MTTKTFREHAIPALRGSRLVPETDLERALLREVIAGRLFGRGKAYREIGYSDFDGQTRDVADSEIELTLTREWTPDGCLVGTMRCTSPEGREDIVASFADPSYRVYWYCEEVRHGGEIDFRVTWVVGELINADPSSVQYGNLLERSYGFTNCLPYLPLVMIRDVWRSPAIA